MASQQPVSSLTMRADPVRLAAILDSTIEGVYCTDLEGCCTFINRAAARMLGYSVEEMLGRNMHELIHHRHADGSPYSVEECPIAQSCRKGDAARNEDEAFWRRGGTPIPVEYSSAPIREETRSEARSSRSLTSPSGSAPCDGSQSSTP
jgi:PAS domain S-box-containing protein